jgi:asparagine synthase (glutamine-hydrolysing)
MEAIAGMLLPQPRLHGEALIEQVRSMGLGGDPQVATAPHATPGIWVDAQSGLALFQRAPASFDPQWLGRCSMLSADGRWVLAMDGRLSQPLQLRAALSALGHRFRGSSQAELLLAAVAEWGVEEALERCAGSFAVAAWDRRQASLWLARSRHSAVPLYYGWAGESLVFGSGLKTLWRHRRFDNPLDPAAVALYLRLGHVPAPHCLHRRTHKLGPGQALCLSAIDLVHGRLPDAVQVVQATEAVEDETRLDALLRQRLQALESTPVTVLCSGRPGSSLLAAVAKAWSGAQVQTLGARFLEGPASTSSAAAVAAELGLAHTAVELDARASAELLAELPAIFDEPEAGAAPLFSLAMARRLGAGGSLLYGVGLLPSQLRGPPGRLARLARRLGIGRRRSPQPVDWILGLDTPLPALRSDPGHELQGRADVRRCRHARAFAGQSLDVHAPLPEPAGPASEQVLAQVLGRYLPRYPLTAAAVSAWPAGWLRQELRPWAEGLLLPARIEQSGVLDPVRVQQAWSGVLAGEAGWAQALWPVLQLQAWHLHWRRTRGLD